MIVPLDTSVSATIGTDGTAQVTTGPVVAGSEWRIRRMTVTSTSDDTTEARIYLNAVLDSRLLGGTYTGNQDTNETDLTLQNLDKLIVRWVNGTPGAICVFFVQGQIVGA